MAKERAPEDLRRNWWSGISAQVLALGSVPLAFLIAVLLFGVTIQRQQYGDFARAGLSTRIVAQSDRVYDILDRESQAIQRYDKTRSAKDDSAIRALAGQLHTTVSSLTALVENSRRQLPLFRRYRKLTLAVARILDVYHGTQIRQGHAAAARYAASPAVAATLRRWRDTKTAFDREQTAFAIQNYTASRRHTLPYQRAAFAMTVVGCIVTLAFFALFGMRIVRRLQRAAFNARVLAVGSDAPPVGGNDEIGSLDRQYRSLTTQLRRALDEKQEALMAYRRERRVASTLQRALLPQSFPHLNGLHVHTAYIGAESEVAIGGDWYDLFEIGDGIVGISAGDVAGHGIAAATLMAAVRQSVRSAARASDDPGVVLEHVNRILCWDEDDALVSATFATFDTRSGRLSYAIAGHPPPLVISPALNAHMLDGRGGTLLGIEPGAQFESQEETLVPGSSMIFYSDGLIEHERTPVEGIEQLLAAAIAEAKSPAYNPADGLQSRVLRGRSPHDDSAVMYLVYSNAVPDQARWRKEWAFDARDEDAATRVKRAIFWQLLDHIAPSESVNVEVVYGELIANVARHTPGPAQVEMECRGDEIILSVSDRGRPFELNIPREVDFFSESGRGMLLVASLTKSYSVVRRADGNCVTVSFPAFTRRSRLDVAARMDGAGAGRR